MDVDNEEQVGEHTESMDLSENIKEELEIKDELVETKSGKQNLWLFK